MKYDWNQIYKDGAEYAPISNILLESLDLDGGTALDVGCGRGELVKQLEDLGYITTGIDLAPVVEPDIVGDFMKHDFGGEKFDLVTVNKVLAFNPMKAFLMKCKSLLNEDGRLVVFTTITRSDRVYDGHYRKISVYKDRLEHILDELFDFELVHIDYVGEDGERATYLCKVV